jgi:hypothetical protein
MALILLMFYIYFLSVLIMKPWWILSNGFSVLVVIIVWLCPSFCLCCNISVDLCGFNHPCLPRMNLIWSWYAIFLMCSWIQVVCWEFLHPHLLAILICNLLVYLLYPCLVFKSG